MSVTLSGGRPQVQNLVVDDNGGRYHLGVQSAELIFRVQSGESRLYFTQLDFDQDRAYVTLNGQAFYGEFRIRASVQEVWLRGQSETDLIIVQQAA